MARLGAEDLVAGVETALYAPAAGATVKVIFANRTQAPVRVRVIRRAGPAATVAKDFLAFDEILEGNDSRHSEYIDMANPEELLAQANAGGISVQADGIES